MIVFLFFSGVFLPSVQGGLMNVALLKPAYLSSQWSNFVAENGVDGQTGTIAHAHNNDDWFVVDLLKEFNVHHVVVFNRKDRTIDIIQFRFANFIVGLAPNFDKDNNKPVRGKYELCGQWSGDAYGYHLPMRVNCNKAAAKARHVILQTYNPNHYLNFNEIEVYAESFDVNDAYRGCYGELSDTHTRFEDVTNVVDCLTICEGTKNSYSLIKSGLECFCSDHLPSTSSSSLQCSLKCSADNNPCGSSQLYCVYQIKTVEKAIKKSLGCYIDKVDRDLPYRFYKDDHMTIELCFETCLRNGYSYSGLQYELYCSCGNSYGKHGQGVGCDITCAGNRDQICGGRWENSIYESCYTYDGVMDTCSTDLHHCSDGSPPRRGECGSCEAGWKLPSCLLRDCSVSSGGCGDHKCEKYSVGEVETDECVCNKGYFKKNYNDKCQDIDECNTSPNKCQRNISTCINNEGSYTCDCSVGYENKDSITCIDIDECDRNTDTCDRNVSTCINNQGSYTCQCLVGYEKNDNKTCIESIKVHQKLEDMMQDLLDKVTILIESNKKLVEDIELLKLMKCNTKTSQQEVTVGLDLKMLPLADLEQFKKFEARMLEDDNLSSSLEKYLASKSALTVGDTVSCMLGHIFTNKLAKVINWTGSNEKAAFGQSLIKKTLMKTVEANARETFVETEVEKKMKRWFHLAADRDGGRQARRDRSL